MSLTIYFLNESSLSENDAWRIAWACDYQVRFHYARAGWRADVRCSYIAKGVPIPAGAAVMHLMDTSDQQGALGYHDEDGNEVPTGKVFVKTAQQYGDDPCAVASHEVLELATDPNINLTALTGDGSRLYAVEVGDPVQGSDYDLGQPEGRTIGLKVANFATPAYFDPSTTTEKVDFLGVLKAPFTITPGGYMSYVDTANWKAGWQQVFGHAYKGPKGGDPDDERLKARFGRFSW